MNVDCKVYGRFCKYCKEEGIVMSKQVEKFMDKMLKENKR